MEKIETGPTTKHKIVTERGRIQIRKKEVINHGTRRGVGVGVWGIARDSVLKTATSGGEEARIDEVRGKDIIGTVFWGHLAAIQ